MVHGIDRRELQRRSPIMAGRIVIHADRGVDHTADQISHTLEKELGTRTISAVADLPGLKFKSIDSLSPKLIAVTTYA